MYLKNGEEYFSTKDLSIQGRVVSVEIIRSYSSREDSETPFGYGWDMNYNMKVYKTSDSNIIGMLDGENRALRYTLVAGSDPNKYKGPAGYYDFLLENEDSTYTLYKKHGTELYFNSDGRLSKTKDRHGNSITFTYTSGLLTKITDDLNRDINLSYDANDKLSTVTDFESRQWTYEYDDHNNLTGITSPSTTEYPNGLKTTYGYNDAGDVHNLTSITDANNQTFFENNYDAQDRVKWQKYGDVTEDANLVFDYNPDSNQTMVTHQMDVNTLTVYNDTGNPLSRTIYTKGYRSSDPSSYTTSYQYDPNVNVTREILPGGNYTDYWYDPNGNLLKISREPNDGDPNIVTSYTYDANFNFVKTMTAPDGNVTTYYYDENGALDFNGSSDYVDVPDDDSLDFGTDSFSIAAWIRIEGSTSTGSSVHTIVGKRNPTGNKNQFLFCVVDVDRKLRLSTYDGPQSQITGVTTISNGNWYHVVGIRNSNGIMELYVDGVLDNSASLTVRDVDNNAFLGIGIHSTQGVNYFNGVIDDVRVYDKALSENEIEAMYLTGEVNDANLVAHWEMDDNADNTTVVDSSGNNNNGTSVRNTSAMHVLGKGAANLVKITYPQVNTPTGNKQPTVRFEYNAYGQVVAFTDPCGIITKAEYGNDKQNDPNNYGRLVKVIMDYNETASNALNITSEYEYDALGRVSEVNDPNGYKTKLAYNALDLLTKITDPCTNVTNFSYNKVKKISQIEREITSDPNQIMSFTYNILDRLETLTDPCSYVAKFSYDASENLSDVNDAEDNNTQYDYDERNLLWKVTDANGNVTEYSYTLNGKLADINDAKGNVTSYHYDGFDRLLWIQYPDDTNEVFSYDKNSNVTSRKNRKGETINYKYDALNRLIEKDRPGEPNITFMYGIAGRLVEVNDHRPEDEGGGWTIYWYDRIGRVWLAGVSWGNPWKAVTYKYDDRGLRTMLAVGDYRFPIIYTYDELGRVTEIEQGTHDILVLAEYEYDELSRRILLTLHDDSDVNVIYEYDIADKLEKLTNNLDGPNTIVFEYDEYDKVGNRLTMTVDGTEEHEYKYNVLYEVNEVNYPAGYPHDVVTYSYDALGNRTSVVNGGTTNYDSNSLNQYTSVGGESYRYDKNGNLTDINSAQYEYVYDCENRLIEAKENGSTVAAYKYDYAGRRVRKIVYGEPNVVTGYLYDGDQVIGEYDVNGTTYTLLRKFYYGPGIDEPICMQRFAAGGGAGRFYYHYNGLLGSVVALSDVNGTVIESYEYDIFGAPTIYDYATLQTVEESTVGNPYFFTGRRLDPETDLYYYRARYYDPYIGRFLQTDPIGYYYSTNLYEYCWNDPINWIDPWGLYARRKDRKKGYHWNLQDTQGHIRRARKSYWHPMKHWMHEQYDYKGNRYRNDTFEVPKGKKGTDTLTASEFGNYMAGYLGMYKLGIGGYLGVRAGGNFLGNTQNISIFSGDDPDSIRDINRGAGDALTDIMDGARRNNIYFPK